MEDFLISHWVLGGLGIFVAAVGTLIARIACVHTRDVRRMWAQSASYVAVGSILVGLQYTLPLLSKPVGTSRQGTSAAP